MENKFGKVSKLHLVAACKNGKTILEDVSFTAPFKIMRPYYETGTIMTVMQQTASAGIMAGDQQEIDLRVKKGARMKLVSQAYEKIHKMTEGYASRKTDIHVEANAFFHYMPLPVIPFTDSDFRGEQRIYLEDDSARLIYQEILVCGRVAHGEEFGYRSFENHVSIYKGKKLVYLDNTRYVPNHMDMAGYGMYEGYTHLANLIVCNQKISSQAIRDIRVLLEETEEVEGGVTLTAYGDLVARILGRRGDQLETLLTSIKNLL